MSGKSGNNGSVVRGQAFDYSGADEFMSDSLSYSYGVALSNPSLISTPSVRNLDIAVFADGVQLT